MVRATVIRNNRASRHDKEHNVNVAPTNFNVYTDGKELFAVEIKSIGHICVLTGIYELEMFLPPKERVFILY